MACPELFARWRGHWKLPVARRATEPVVSGGAQECFGTRFARVQLENDLAVAGIPPL
jgi:hypothetical protein